MFEMYPDPGTAPDLPEIFPGPSPTNPTSFMKIHQVVFDLRSWNILKINIEFSVSKAVKYNKMCL